MDFSKMTTERLKMIVEKAKQAIAKGEAKGRHDEHPLMKAAHGTLGAASAALASR